MDHVRIADPTGSRASGTTSTIQVRGRPTRVDGLQIGLLDNGKPNAAWSLRAMADRLHRQHEVSHVPLSKAVASKPCPDELLVRFRAFDAAIVGVGD